MNNINNEKKILIIEDNDVLRNMLQSWLVDLFPECHIQSAPSGEAGLSYMNLIKPDLVIVDIKLPGINGIDVTKNIKASGFNVEVIVLSIFDSINYQNDAYAAGAKYFINKKDMHIRLPLEIQSILNLKRN